MDKKDRGEADQLFSVYTKEFGKLEILGRAVRKIKSKLRPGADLFCFSEIEFIQGKTYKILTDAVLTEKFGETKKDLKKITVARKVSQALLGLIPGQEADEKIWSLLKETFFGIKECDHSKSCCQLAFYYFVWNLFLVMGYGPDLYRCSLCQKKLVPEKLFFNSTEGGIICQNCSKSVKSNIEISPETVKILRVILKKNLSFIFRLKVKKNDLKELDLVTKNYYSYTQP